MARAAALEEGGDGNRVRDGEEGKRGEEKGGVSRPKFKGRENLARQSAAGRKKVPVRRQALAFSLCIFDTTSARVYTRAFSLFCDGARARARATPDAAYNLARNFITLRATGKR